MTTEKTDTLVVGGGQAGIAMSAHLTTAGIPHIVLERARIAERWRSERWDSLVANGPAWHDRFPTLNHDSTGPEGFPGKEKMADYFVRFADEIKSPLRTGVEVKRVSKRAGAQGFLVETSDGMIEADRVVAATGAFQRPVMPDLVPETAGLTQMHSTSYRSPGALPDGAVLVVGAGSSGAQIADELMQSGRKVYLSIGPHDRPPRAYRGRDYCWWLGVLGEWDRPAPKPGTEHVTIAVSGAEGGKTVDFRRMAQGGMTLLGRAEGYESGRLQISDGLQAAIAAGDANYLSVLNGADAYIARNGLDLPEEPEAHILPPDPESLTNPIRELDLTAEGITTIIWATGFARDYSWLQVDAVDDSGTPIHQRGVSPERGVYFLGLPWQSRRGSSFIWGVWHDAKYLADIITIQRDYERYEPGCGVAPG